MIIIALLALIFFAILFPQTIRFLLGLLFFGAIYVIAIAGQH